jgi:hypothetical protein
MARLLPERGDLLAASTLAEEFALERIREPVGELRWAVSQTDRPRGQGTVPLAHHAAKFGPVWGRELGFGTVACDVLTSVCPGSCVRRRGPAPRDGHQHALQAPLRPEPGHAVGHPAEAGAGAGARSRAGRRAPGPRPGAVHALPEGGQVMRCWGSVGLARGGFSGLVVFPDASGVGVANPNTLG